jgi:hypothetical protein
MGSKCSSESGGCVSCIEPLNLWYVEATTEQSKVGFTCLNSIPNGNVYWNKSINSTESSSKDGNGSGGLPGGGTASLLVNYNGACQNSETYFYDYRIDSYGNIETDVGYNIVNQGAGSIAFNPDSIYQSFFCEPSCSCPSENSNPQGVIATTKLPFQSEQINGNGDVYCGPGADRLYGGSCSDRDISYSHYSCSEQSNTLSECEYLQNDYSLQDSLTNIVATDCAQSIIKTLPCRTDPSNPSCFRGIPYNSNHNYTSLSISELSSSKDLSFFYSITLESVDRKIAVLEQNLPQNSNGDICGDGNIDNCWSPTVDFSILNNNLSDPNASTTTGQKLKFKISFDKKTMKKKYKNISGKVYFYYGGSGDTPCCTNCGTPECFTGTIVKEAHYSLSADSAVFKETLVSEDVTDFDNSNQNLLGETIKICYKVENIDFM